MEEISLQLTRGMFAKTILNVLEFSISVIIMTTFTLDSEYTLDKAIDQRSRANDPLFLVTCIKRHARSTPILKH